MKMERAIAAVIGVTVLATGCATGQGEAGEPREPAARAQTAHAGVVESVREVQIDRRGSGIGPVVGAVVGGVAGSNVGHGSGAAVGSILGSVVGGIAGNAAEQTATRQAGYEITVRLDGGRVIAVTQATDERFSPGDRVRVLSDGVTARVTR